MATSKQVQEESKRIDEKIREIKKKNPLVEVGLGNLVIKMHELYASDSNVIKPEDQIPSSSMSKYKQYQAIAKELNRREIVYNRNSMYRGY